MLIKQKKKIEENSDLLERIKSEIQSQLGNRGVDVSGINMQINPNNISLNIYISGSKRLA